MVTNQLQVRCRRGTVGQSETDVLPLSYTTNHLIMNAVLVLDFYCQEHLVLVSSSANHYTTWSVSKFVGHHVTVNIVESVAFNTHTHAMSVAFEITDKVGVSLHCLYSREHTLLLKQVFVHVVDFDVLVIRLS